MSSEFRIPCILMAGADLDNRGELEIAENQDYKALIDIKGKTIITRMMEAFEGTNIVSKYYIVGLPEELIDFPDTIDKSKIEFIIPKGAEVPERLQETAKVIIEQAKTNKSLFSEKSQHILFASGDLPMMTSESILDLVERTQNFKYDLYFAMVEESIMSAAFPDNRRTYAKLVEGRYCMADLLIFDINVVNDQRSEKLETLRENRKVFAKVVLRLSPMTVIRFIIGRLSFPIAEKAIDKIFDFRTKIIQSEYPELAFDMDKPHQVIIARDKINP